jgi:hypothetical protein
MRRSHAIFFGVCDVLTALLVAIGVFALLPARWWVVDGFAAITSAALLASAVGLYAKRRRVVRYASMLVLAIGLLLVAILAITASYVSGIYGAIGQGGAVIMVLLVLLTIPYLVALPAAKLVWVK